MALALALAAGASVAGATAPQRTNARPLAVAERHLALTARALPPGAYPGRTPRARGQWVTTSAESWTSGFFPASLWLMAELTGERSWRAPATRAQRGLAGQASNTATHDVGFILHTPYARAYRLTRRAAYRRVLLRGARSLASRFDPEVGATRSWGREHERPFKVIVDNLMNLELLLWAARHGGSPQLRQIAVQHGLTTLRDHVRPDGSTFHLVEYDPDTGAVLRRGTRQGVADGSTWSRGQAWAVHGFATLYRETGDRRFLIGARRTADHWRARLPGGGVPPWDFDAPRPAPPDSSAGAVAASGLLGLARVEPDPERSQRYRRVAERTLRALSSRAYLDVEGESDSILLHGTPDGARGRFDQGLVYGDYYFLEALLRLRKVSAREPRRASN